MSQSFEVRGKNAIHDRSALFLRNDMKLERLSLTGLYILGRKNKYA